MKLFGKKIGPTYPIYFIAEIGVNHNGKLSLAKKLIDKAKESKASAVKFQTFFAEEFVTKKTKKVKYQIRNTKKKESHYEMIKSLELSEDNHKDLIMYSKRKKIDFISTPYNKKAAEMLNKLGCNVFKTSSADITDLEMHEFLAKTNKKVIISTGMSSLKEIDECIDIYKKYKNNQFILLHCVSNYPCNKKSINLKSIELLKERYQCLVGYSDHSIGNISSLVSVVLGASLIEKHFTISKSLKGPDHKTSILPNEFLNLVNETNDVRLILGKKEKKCQSEEIEMKNISRKSLTIIKELKKGEKLNKDNLALKRPGTGLPYKFLNEILGLHAKYNLKVDRQVLKKDFK